jgi:hypothetical protein
VRHITDIYQKKEIPLFEAVEHLPESKQFLPSLHTSCMVNQVYGQLVGILDSA